MQVSQSVFPVLFLAPVMSALVQDCPFHLEFTGSVTNGLLGDACSGGGDVNGDGTPDILVGERNDGAGNVYAYSGVDGSLIHELSGENSGDAFGFAVADAGDLDCDGFDDFLVGADRADITGTDSGRVYVFSGQLGLLLRQHSGEAGGDFFGGSVVSLGDLNGDTVPDYAVGAGRNSFGGTDAGRVYVYSGIDGAVLTTYEGDPGDWFGSSIANAGDVTGDGVSDLMVGSPKALQSKGTVVVICGVTGQEVHRFIGESSNDSLRIVEGVGDVTGDGCADLLMASLGFDSNRGRVYLRSGFDGSLLRSWDGEAKGNLFGISMAAPGDVTGDGVPDFLIGATDANGHSTKSGKAYLYSGATLQLQFVLNGEETDDDFGRVGAVGDLDGDGRGDFIVGAARWDSRTASNSGKATVYLAPRLSLDIQPAVAAENDPVTFTTIGGAPSARALLYVHQVNGAPFLYRVSAASFDGTGTWVFGAVVPPGVTGFDLEFFTLGIDACSQLGLSNLQTLTLQ